MMMLRVFLSLSIAGLINISPIVQAKSNPDINWLPNNQQVLQQQILPSYQKLATASANMQQSIANSQQDCVGNWSAVVSTWQQDFRVLFNTWAAIQVIRFGPIVYLERYERFHYWPDKHSRGGRQLQQLLAQTQPLTLAALQEKSVAVQGLGALERLLWSDVAELDPPKRRSVCRLIALIAENLQQISDEVYQAWVAVPVEFAKEFAIAGKSAAMFASDAQIARQLLNDMGVQLAVIEAFKLSSAMPVVKGKTKIRPKRLEAWRSRQSLNLIKNNIASIKSLYHLGFAPQLKPLNASLHQQIEQALNAVDAVLQDIDKPLYDVLAETNSAPAYQYIPALQQAIATLSEHLGVHLPAELNLRVAFNALDGD